MAFTFLKSPDVYMEMGSCKYIWIEQKISHCNNLSYTSMMGFQIFIIDDVTRNNVFKRGLVRMTYQIFEASVHKKEMEESWSSSKRIGIR